MGFKTKRCWACVKQYKKDSTAFRFKVALWGDSFFWLSSFRTSARSGTFLECWCECTFLAPRWIFFPVVIKALRSGSARWPKRNCRLSRTQPTNHKAILWRQRKTCACFYSYTVLKLGAWRTRSRPWIHHTLRSFLAHCGFYGKLDSRISGYYPVC